MAFNSVLYLLFLAGVVLLYYRLKPRFRTYLLLVASWVFYASYNFWFTWLLAFTTLFAYFVGLKIGAASDAVRRKRWLVSSVVVNLAVLAGYKYPAFLFGNTQSLLGLLGIELPPFAIHVVLPLGISFYTFEAISYTVDVYRRDMEPVKTLKEFALFLAFFPHLVAGPIIRAPELIAQLTGRTTASSETFRRGLALFLYGMCKKVYVADVMSKLVGDVYAAPERYSAVSLTAATYAFAVQIYCDFSGYSDMAIGSALLFGIRLPENFARPYLSLSIKEFWQRWHMTLSRWLRDYLYIPLGGNRHGPFRTNVHMMITMLLGGLWHGAGWNWIVWGGIQGGVMGVERSLDLADRPKARWLGFVRWAFTFHIVCISWIFFRSRTVGEAWLILSRIIQGAKDGAPGGARLIVYTAAGGALMFAGNIFQFRRKWQDLFAHRPWALRWVCYATVLVLVLTFTRAAHPEFIYFAF